MKTRPERPHYRVPLRLLWRALRIFQNAKFLKENDIPGASLLRRKPEELKTSKIKFWLKCCGDAVKRVHYYIRNLLSGPNKGRNCFLITLNILLSSRKQSFSIEIVWQITTMMVKSCEQLHLVDPVIHSFPAKAILLWHLCFLSTELIIPCFYIQIFLIVVNLLVDWQLIP